MIKFDRLFKLLDERGLNKNFLRLHKIHANTVNRMLHNQSVNTDIIDRICELLSCQPSDIMEHVPCFSVHLELKRIENPDCQLPEPKSIDLSAVDNPKFERVTEDS